MKFRYIIHCAQMPREEVIVVNSVNELLKTIAEHIAQYGPLDLLYNVGRV